MTQKTRIHSKCPIRIDLAGGTLDIWPLYLMVPQPVTVNMGIDLFAEAWVEWDPSGKNEVTLTSKDQKVEQTLGWDELSEASLHPGLSIHLEVLKHFQKVYRQQNGKPPSGHLKMESLGRSPAGAGLGGSSALGVAMTSALYAWARGLDHVDVGSEGIHLIETIRDIESRILKIPAGMQDYYGATFGGLQAIEWGAGGHQRDALSNDLLHEVSRRLILFYSGKTRNSGLNNWALFKGLLDGDDSVKARFAAIGAAAVDLRTALRAKNWIGVGQAIADEWETRKTLADGISTPEIDRTLEAAQELGAAAFKVCGAGGGGCFFVYLAEPDSGLAARIIAQAKKFGVEQLPFHPVETSLNVTIEKS